MELRSRGLVKYVTSQDRCPFDEWFSSLKDKRVKATVATRLNRLAQGNFGLCRNLGPKFWELKIDFGPGLRVYFGEDGDKIVVLLAGGDKSTQSRDIESAKNYWADYLKD